MLYVCLGIVIGFIVFYIIVKKNDWYETEEFAIGGIIVTSMLSVIILFIHMICMWCAPIDVAMYQEERASLVYQMENIKYDNIIDNNQLELHTQIKEYNKSVAECEYGEQSFWLSCFYHKDYQQLEKIEYNVIE